MKKLLLLLCLMLIGLCACSNNNIDISGHYQLKQMINEIDDESLDEEMVKELRASGLDMIIDIEKDNTGIIDVYGLKSPITFDLKKKKAYFAWVENEEVQEYPFTIKDGILTIGDSKAGIVFEKIED